MSPFQSDVPNEPHRPEACSVIPSLPKKFVSTSFGAEQAESGTNVAALVFGHSSGVWGETQERGRPHEGFVVGAGGEQEGRVIETRAWVCPASSPGSPRIPGGWLQPLARLSSLKVRDIQGP